MKALVTGAAGFIGSHLAEALLARGGEVVGLDCFTDYYPLEVKRANLDALRSQRQFHFIEASLQTADLDQALDGVTHVFHLAAQAGVRKSWGRDFGVYTSHNVDATQRLLEAVKSRRLTRFVYASSSSVYGDQATLPLHEGLMPRPVSPYGVTKLAAEHLCGLYAAAYGVPAVSLRYFTVYGPRQRPDMAFHRFLKAAAAGQPIELYGDGEQTRDFTYVGDAVTATMAAGDRGRPGAVYNIGGGSRVTVNRTLALVADVTGRPVNIRRQPEQAGDMRDTLADTTKARAELAFSPATSLETGMAAEWAWVAGRLAASAR